MNYYGYYRNTLDIDVWIAVDPQNAGKLSKVWQRYADFHASEVPPSIFLEAGAMFRFGRRPALIELVTEISGVKFAECYKRRKAARIDRLTIPVISLKDLKTNKRASGPLKDLDDLDHLP